MTNEEYQFLCQSNDLKALLVNNISLKRNKKFSTVYAASPSGLFMYHPGFKDKTLCESNFDPRVRPWFSTGSTGMQNIVLFFLIKDNESLGKAKELGEYFKNIIKASDWTVAIDLNNCPQTICAIHGLATDYYKQ